MLNSALHKNHLNSPHILKAAMLLITYISCFILTSLLFSCNSPSREFDNLDFEVLDNNGNLIGWIPIGKQQSGSLIDIDTVIKYHGKRSIRISSNGEDSKSTVFYRIIPSTIKGTRLQLNGYIKSENVTHGYGNLWINVEDEAGKIISANKLKDGGIKTTKDWTKVSVEVNYNPAYSHKIYFGAILRGNGRIWVDNLELLIDGKPFYKGEKRIIHKADKDTCFQYGSHIKQIYLTAHKIKQLANLGKIWSFIKYYHPAVAKGEFQFDAELFRVLPKLLSTVDDKQFYNVLEAWVDSFGKIPPYQDSIDHKKNVAIEADYGYLFNDKSLPGSLLKKLAYIRDNYTIPNTHYYIKFTTTGNPVFLNELKYKNSPYPDAGVRLLSLYSYWAKIQYFYPYKYCIGNDWNKILEEFIPQFINSKNESEYKLSCLKLITKINDTHAYYYDTNGVIDSMKGTFMAPFKAEFVEGQLVVTGYYTTSLEVREKVKIGQVINKIDGKSIKQLVKKYDHLTPASNNDAKLRQLTSPHGFLLRSNSATGFFLIGESKIKLKRIKIDSVYKYIKREIYEKEYIRLLEKNIGYIYTAELKPRDLETIKKRLNKTSGLIIDLRCYPSIFMPFKYGKWLKPINSPFALLTKSNLKQPGSFVYFARPSNGAELATSDTYKGKLVIIVNSKTQSRGEYTAMALSTVPGAMVLGSTTAGADGDISLVNFPGGFSSYISGLGIYYPDSTKTQRVGVKIDIFKKPTIRGIQGGEDELLQEAVNWIKETAN